MHAHDSRNEVSAATEKGSKCIRSSSTPGTWNFGAAGEAGKGVLFGLR